MAELAHYGPSPCPRTAGSRNPTRRELCAPRRGLFSPGRHNEHEDPHVVAAAAALGVSDGLRPSGAELKELEAAMETPSVALRRRGASGRLLAPGAVDQGRRGPGPERRGVGRRGPGGRAPARLRLR